MKAIAIVLLLAVATPAAGQSPNDSHYARQWHLPYIKAPEAWAGYQPRAPVIVAMIDTGITEVADLAGRLVPGWNFVDNNDNAVDDRDHGTPAAALVAAVTNNGVGVAGVVGAADVKLMPLRVTDSTGFASATRVVAAINWASAHGAHVIYINVNHIITVSSIRRAAQNAVNAGAVVLAPASNNVDDLSCSAVPDTDSMISVSGIQQSPPDHFWDSPILGFTSSCGPYVDIAAPATSVFSASMAGSYRSYFGTSFAGPIATGVVAYMRAVAPGRTSAQIEAALKASAVDLGTPGRDDYFGFGKINLSEALRLLVESSPEPQSIDVR